MNYLSLYYRVQRVFLKLLQPVFSRFYSVQSSKKTRFRYRSIEIIVYPGVFHPRFTISTKYFVDYLYPMDLKGKKVLELGCGSGLISLYAAKKGGIVTASDINPSAIEGLRYNVEKTGLAVNCINSDLFENIHSRDFDFIIINPPYYPKNAENVEQAAWYCGEDFEYFHRLFEQLPVYAQVYTKVFMVLSEDCALDKIKDIAEQNEFQLEKRDERIISGEENYIFLVKRN